MEQMKVQINPQLKAQSKWGWFVAAYLFLAGVGAGAYVTGAVAGFLGADWYLIAAVGVVLALPCVLLGAGFLVLDLGTPKNFWRAFLRPGTSWVARGTIVISIFMIVDFIHIVLWAADVVQAGDVAWKVIAVVGGLFAFGTMIYTGLLLGANRPIAFWSTALVPVLFLISALSTGIMAVILVTILNGGETPSEQLEALGRVDIVLVILESLVVAMYLQATHRVPESRASAQLVLTGSVSRLFWIGVVALGLAVPLALELVGVFAAEGSGASALAALAAVSGLIGGLCLRMVVLSGGVQAPLRAGRFEFALPSV